MVIDAAVVKSRNVRGSYDRVEADIRKPTGHTIHPVIADGSRVSRPRVRRRSRDLLHQLQVPGPIISTKSP